VDNLGHCEHGPDLQYLQVTMIVRLEFIMGWACATTLKTRNTYTIWQKLTEMQPLGRTKKTKIKLEKIQ
jgi:hypothetical protein